MTVLRLSRATVAGPRRESVPRVTYVIGTYPLVTTTFIDLEIRGLQRLGVDVGILAVRRPHEDVSLSPDQAALRRQVTYLLPITIRAVVRAHLKWFARHPFRYVTTLGLLVTRPHPGRRARAKTLIHFGEGICAAEALEDAEPGELHAHFVDRAATIALTASRMIGIPYSVSVHTGADVFVEPVMLREKISHARTAVTCTANNKVHLAKIVGSDCAERVTVVPHGVPLARNAPKPRVAATPPVILAVAQLTERKGLHHLVDACAALRDLGYEFECRIIGCGPQADALAQRVRDAGLGDRVTLCGVRPHDEVLDEYARATLFVLPCVTAPDGDVDGIPNVLLEAMSMRVPVVTSDLPAIREVVAHGDNGLLVCPGDQHALTVAMSRLLDAPGLRARLGARGRETVRERFDARTNVHRLATTLWPAVFAPDTFAEVDDVVRTPRRWVAIAWAPYSRRSEMFARALGGTLHCVHYLKFRSPPHAPFKYLLQSLRTLQLLRRDRPTAVHVQNPPFVCGLVVSLYCRLTGARFVIEYHSAAFGPMWRWALPLQRFVARRATVNIVTNEHHAGVVRSWGGRALVMYDAFLDLPEGRPYAVRPGCTVAFAGTFAPDEPLEAVLEAAARHADVTFYVTGDIAKAPARLVAGAPPNVVFTGFLDPNGEYLGLLRAVDVVMVLTTRDNTLQLAGCEAVALGRPLVTSDWAYLRDLFAAGAVFVDDSAAGIAAGVGAALEQRAQLAAGAEDLRDLRRREWKSRLDELDRLVFGRAVQVGGSSRSNELVH